MSRVRRVADREEMERSVDEFVVRGYEITSQSRSSTRLKEKDWGSGVMHFLVAILTVWWTLGLANALYAIYKRVTAEEVVVRIDDEAVEATDIDRIVEIPARERTIPLQRFLQSGSLLVAGFVLLTIFAIYTGQIGSDYILPTIVSLALAISFRYVAVYHRFTSALYRKALLLPITVAFAASSWFTVERFVETVSVGGLRRVFQTDSVGVQSTSFLPEWWVAAILVPAGLLILLGSLVPRDLEPYPRPTEIRAIAVSPAYFGCLCMLSGLWAVLFVGISVQRVVVIAPIFEELLKFGIALLIGSVLFDRSLLARIGVAAVVGSLFGLVEHATTYPAEPDSLYLFRTSFHAVSTVLSVSVYTYFESLDRNRLQWLAPAFSILIHFFYNTFAVLSSLILVLVFGSQTTLPTLVYGGIAILVAANLVALVLLRHRAIRLLHMPLENVLSDLV